MGDRAVDRVKPGKKWEFGADVAAVFDDMLERSIPQYGLMRDLCYKLGREFLRDDADVVDLGCSRGGALARYTDAPPTERPWPRRLVGLEISEPMAVAAAGRFVGLPSVQIRTHDLREGIPGDLDPSLILSVLTLQFTPIEYRQGLVQQAFECLRPGGALIVVEKVLGAGDRLDDLLKRTYWEMKAEHGYSEEQIRRKALSLEGVLVPVTARWNEELLRNAGFEHVDCFWRCLSFAGWLAVKR